MGEKRGTKALEVWCKRVTEGYPGVKVENMTTSWRDGLAFCALIHHFRPDLIDFDSLDKRDVYRNNELAFRIAERHLGIPALLDAEDMVEYEVPDRLSMLTYLSQFYQTFVSQQGHSPNSRTPVKRSSVSPMLSSSPDLSPSMSPTSSSPPTKVAARGVTVGSSSRPAHDSCTHCGLPVFLAERLLVGSKRALYHRTCFRCARCSAQLTLANCYETEDGGFCCETCPDEELDKSDTSSQGTDRIDFSDGKSESLCSAEVNHKSFQRSLSDDEKTESQQARAANFSDEYSALFESTVESSHRKKSETNSITDKASLAIPQEVPNDLLSKSDESSQKSLQNPIVYSRCNEGPTDSDPVGQCDELSMCQSTKEGTEHLHQDFAECERPLSGIKQKGIESDAPTEVNVNSPSFNSDSGVHQSPISVSTEHSEVNNCTKDSKISSAGSSASSIVKMRRMLFEGDNTNTKVENVTPLRKLNKVKSGEVCNVEMGDATLIDKKVEVVLVSEDCVVSTKDRIAEKDEISDGIVLDIKADCELSKGELESSVHSADGEKIPADKIDREENLTVKGEFVAKLQKDVVEKEEKDTVAPDFSASVKPSVSPRKTSLPHKHPDKVPLQEEKEEYPVELNPFGDEDEEEAAQTVPKVVKVESNNPFGSSDEEDEEVVLRKKSVPEKPPRPPPPLTNLQSGRPATMATVPSVSPVPAQRRVIPAPVSLNPFWSDGEEPEDDSASTPVPLPRMTVRLTPEPSPRPRTTIGTPQKLLNSSGKFGSSSSLTSMVSNTGTHRRSKKPAPAPPSLTADSSSYRGSLPPSPNPSIRSPHKRKTRPAPQPPTALGTAEKTASLDGRKLQKDEANRNTQATDKEEPSLPRDKSTFGQWKRKKGPAPPRPVPQRRQVRAMPIKELRRELDDIEIKQLELERQGVKLEQTIRGKFDEAPSLNESSMTPDVEDLVIQLFELVNEKNELFRKQAELMYLRRQHRLEEEHAELEYQIRCLMEQPERNKTDIMKAREEELIQRLVEVVERRNEIIECLEMDRLREAEEDQSIHTRLGLFAAKNTADLQQTSPSKSKKEKKKKKEKDSKKKKVDADKDIDEVEAAAAAAVKEKKSKKKWF
ncbi:MICAL-like protein 1 isoform X2 [Thrips palmi]|uniref:MICAL-like protein 1 isoform X2 n=1 Tax=Thrips palmi TaxID=161013 RepID=A0A6P9A5S1_THRPL|nr:MICAL-like protein 1 isoform X2 [Thrips palmi]